MLTLITAASECGLILEATTWTGNLIDFTHKPWTQDPVEIILVEKVTVSLVFGFLVHPVPDFYIS